MNSCAEAHKSLIYGWMDGWMGWDGMDGWDGISKVSFKFLYTLWVYRTCIYQLQYLLKTSHEHSYGFQTNFLSCWRSWSKILKLQQVGDVEEFWVFQHASQSFFNFSHKKASQVVVKIKSELLDRKSITSPTCCNFEIFDHDPQLDIKFINP